jgi:signal peptidase II
MKRRLFALIVAVGVFGLDRWSKWLVESNMTALDTKVVIPHFFNIVRAENPGIAFSILADGASRSRTFLLAGVSVVAILVLAAMLWKIERQDRATSIGLSLIFGGALGNVYDRVRSGRVTDFLDFYSGSYHWYTFNLADSAICIGAGLLILSMLTSGRKKEAGV